MEVALVALNAQYIHTNLAVRSIAAYAQACGGVAPTVLEYTINQQPGWILEQLYRQKADCYIFSCYIWNVEIIKALARDLRKLLPHALLAAGGPEVSYHTAAFLAQNPAFDAVIQGEGEAACHQLFAALAQGKSWQGLAGLVVRAGGTIRANPRRIPPDMDTLPFAYTDLGMLGARIVYYESMRGCPFGCSYCLSSIEKGVRFKSLPLVKQELLRLLRAAPKQVKFVDRTFNCNKQRALEIWRFLHQHDNGTTNFHFELAGELLDDEATRFLAGVRAGLFQFEIGVQSTNPKTLEEIDRPADVHALFRRVQALKAPGNIHLHLDLIAGLPWEGYESFENSFNQVYAQRPHQFQLGFLKVLGGSKMEHKAQNYGLVWQSGAPFEVLYTKWLSYEELAALHGVAHMVELYYNSGRFGHTVAYIQGQFPSAFGFYEKLAAFYAAGGHTAAPLGKLGQYQLLGDFMAAERLAGAAHAGWLCKLDMALHEKPKTPPPFAAANCTAAFGRTILDFYANGKNVEEFLPAYMGLAPKQIRKMAHVEVFPFQPFTGQAGICALLFDYRRRDINGHALVQDITKLLALG